MVKSGKKGFTLIELLAVIVILAIIALIATPIIVGVINKTKKNAFIDTAYGVIEAGKLYYAKNLNNEDFAGETFIFPNNTNDLKLAGEKPGGGTLKVSEQGKMALSIYDKGKNWCASKTEEEEKVSINKYEETTCKGDGDIGYSEPALNGAKPVLPEGLVPVIIGDYGTITKADTTKEWYNYGDKRWANAILVSNDVRSTYQNGDVIPGGKILAYFVWVPRYEYKLFNSETPIEIQINFIAKKKTEPTKDYIIHPAFTFGEEELSGIWVGKFLTTTGSATEPNILPNQVPLQTNVYNLREQFKSALVFGNRTLNMDGTITNNLDKSKYGLTAESRMIRNTEWGAAAYLSHSKYGKNSEIAYNTMSRLDSGCGSFVGSPSMTDCPHKYGNYADSYPQSTTGNITGIFDMAGGYQHVMGLMADAVGSKAPMSGYDNTTNSGFNGKTMYSGIITTGYQFPDKKYYDLYDYGTTNKDEAAYNRSILGDATKETRGWYKDDGNFLAKGASCIVRGGSSSDGERNGAFKHGSTSCSSGTSIYFRTVIS